jgi:hypothetical protein
VPLNFLGGTATVAAGETEQDEERYSDRQDKNRGRPDVELIVNVARLAPCSHKGLVHSFQLLLTRSLSGLTTFMNHRTIISLRHSSTLVSPNSR